MKVNVKENPPSAEVVAKAQQEFTAVDTAGRTITLKKPGVLAQYRLIELVGGEAAKNEVYMAMILPLIFVTAIDEDAVFMPSSKRELDALIQRLDEHGIAAVANAVSIHFGASDPEADKAELKN